VLVPLVHVVQEAAGDEQWALVGAASVRLQGVDAASQNLEFVASEQVIRELAEMLDVSPQWDRGPHVAAERLHFMRDGVPVFVFGDPVFHGSYDSISPREIPSLWDARARVDCDGVTVLCTPLEWELLLAVILGGEARVAVLREHLHTNGFDGRLLTRLLREGHAAPATEEAVWAVVENG
jgi:hypothetical protein